MKYISAAKATALLSLVLLLGLLGSGCGSAAAEPEPTGKVYFQYFDTVSYIYNYAGDSAEQFDSCSAELEAILEEYHKLFDIYHEYSGMSNLCTVNKLAGEKPVRVDEKLMEFLLYARELYYLTEGEMNVMLGPVLSLWHDCRELAAENPAEARLPDGNELREAGEHCGIDALEIDEENSTVFINDFLASIDAGAVGKGYAVEKAAQYLKAQGKNGYVLNVGGNLRIIGSKPDGSSWTTAINDPLAPGQKAAMELLLSDTSCVSSGSYERFYTVDGQRFHHIIDKDTLYPAEYFSSVSVICPDSGIADCLSTALFCMSHEDGLRLLEKFPATEVLWIDPEGEMKYTPGLKSLMKD